MTCPTGTTRPTAGWCRGAFGVYVGDSSALASLPLRGSFTVNRSVGARYATLSAPTTVAAGATATVTATLVNNGDFTMPRAQFKLATGRLEGEQPGAGHHPARTDRHRELPVTAPAGAQPGTDPEALGHAPAAATAVARPGGGLGDSDRRRSARSPPPTTTPGSATTPTRRRPTRTGRRQLLGSGARGGYADGAHPRQQGHGRRDHLTWPKPRRGPRKRGHRWPDRRAVRVRDRPRVPRHQPERHRQRHHHRSLHRRQQPALQHQHGGLVRQ